MYSDSPKAKRIEFRCPDAAANPYLAFAAMLMAGIDGIQKGLEPGEPADYDLFEEDRAGSLRCRDRSRRRSTRSRRDHEFLTAGGVFSEELIRTWIAWKRENEVDLVALRPHPAEFALYFDAVGSLEIRELREENWPAVRSIFEQGIATRNATFETEAPLVGGMGPARSSTAIAGWPSRAGEVVGWAAAHPVSLRPLLPRRRRAQRLRRRRVAGPRESARALLERLFESTEQDGIWTIQSGVFPENEASLALHVKCGFRVVGTQERLGKLDGVWRDVVVLERRSEAIT